MAKAKITNARRFVEHVVNSVEAMLMDNYKYSGGLVMPPLYVHNLTEIKIIGNAILAKHRARGTRKDVYLGS